MTTNEKLKVYEEDNAKYLIFFDVFKKTLITHLNIDEKKVQIILIGSRSSEMKTSHQKSDIDIAIVTNNLEAQSKIYAQCHNFLVNSDEFGKCKFVYLFPGLSIAMYGHNIGIKIDLRFRLAEEHKKLISYLKGAWPLKFPTSDARLKYIENISKLDEHEAFVVKAWAYPVGSP